MIDIERLTGPLLNKHAPTGREVVTTLEGFKGGMKYQRRAGNTTRIVDHAIQLLFDRKIIICMDHHAYGENRDSNRYLFNKIMDRLHFEHKLGKDDIEFDRMNCVIYLK